MPIRDGRMLTLLFDTANYSQTRLTEQVDMATVTALEAGQTQLQDVTFELDLHGQQQTRPSQLQLTDLTKGQLMRDRNVIFNP